MGGVLTYAAEFEVSMLKQTLLTAAFLAASHGACAQQAVGAGGQLQQIPPVQAPEKIAPRLRVEPPASPGAVEPGGPTTEVRSLRVTGQTVFSEAELIAASGFTGERTLSLESCAGWRARSRPSTIRTATSWLRPICRPRT